MSEEKIIKEINIIITTLRDILQINTSIYKENIYSIDTRQFSAIQGLLDLYNKEKEKNKDLEATLYYKNGMIDELTLNEHKLKVELGRKIKEKIEVCKKQYEFYINDKRATKTIAKAYEMIIDFLEELLEGK